MFVMAFGGLIATSVAQAESYRFMYYTGLDTGQNYFAPEWYILTYVYGHSTGVAAACVGVSGHPEYQICGGGGEETTTPYIGFKGTGYLHNHSEWNSYFTAWIQGES
jgi:hypothetical protein